MSLQIILQTVCHILSLWHHSHAIGKILHDAAHEQWIMGATQDDGIDVLIHTHQLVDALLDEIISTRTISLVSLYDSSPKRTSHSAYLDIRPELTNLHLVACTLDGSLCGKDTYMAALCQRPNHLGSRADDAEYPSLRIQFRDVSLLDRAQSLSRCRIATQDYQMATHGKELQHSLTRKLIHHLEGARTVWRQHLAQAMQDGQATISGIKDSDRSGIRWQNHFSFSSSTAVISSPISSLR